MLSVQLGSSRHAWMLLFAYASVSLVFALIWVSQQDWIAAAFCLAGVAGVAWMIELLRRRAHMRARATSSVKGRACAQTADGALFVSFAHESVGAWTREGVVLIGPSSAAFVRVGRWTHLVLKLLASPFVVRFRFVDLAIDIPADDDTDADVDQALNRAVERHGGFIIDSDWTYASSQRWLVRPQMGGIVWIERPPPKSLTSQWLAVPPPTPEKFRSIRNRILAGGSAVTTVLGVAGIAVWRLTGDTDYLVAGLFYAVLIGGSVVAAMVLAQRRLAPANA